MQAHHGSTITPANVQVSVLKDGIKTLNGGKVIVSGVSSLGQIVEAIRTSEDLHQKTTPLRQVLTEGGRTGQYEKDKLRMPAIIPAALAPAGTPIKKLPPAAYANGLYGYDIDEYRESLDLPALRTALIESTGSFIVGTSCAGDGLYAIFAGPHALDDGEYQQNWKAIAAQLPPGAKVASGKQSKNFNRLRFLAYDPDVWLADSVTPLPGALDLVSGVPPSSAFHSQHLTAEEEFDRQALTWVEPPAGYNEWLGWLTTHKALGFSVEEVEEWSARSLSEKHAIRYQTHEKRA